MVQRTDGELFWDGTTALMTATSTPFYAAQGAFSAGPSDGYLACAVDNSGTGALWCVGTNSEGALGAGLSLLDDGHNILNRTRTLLLDVALMARQRFARPSPNVAG